MFNAEDIIDLEKKWLKYKIKQKSKLYIFILLVITALFIIGYQFFLQKTDSKPKVLAQAISKKVEIVKAKPIKNENILAKVESNVSVESEKKELVIVKEEDNTTKEETTKISKKILQEQNSKPYIFKLEPTQQASELFSSNGRLAFNPPFKNEIENLSEPIASNIAKETPNIKQAIISEKKKSNITISTQKIDTITYLKEKFYATSSIVFALMLSEEYYNVGEYTNSLKWALTANDIDAQNEKSWYWFAKSKVKLKQNNDAIRALKAFLSHNKSQTLSTLLHKIQLGGNDD